MPSDRPSLTWDFTSVYNLISYLPDPAQDTHREPVLRSATGSNGSPQTAPAAHQPNGQEHVVVPDHAKGDECVSLGNLNRVWDALGIQRNDARSSLPQGVHQEQAAPSLAPYEAYTAAQKQDKDAYVSDGAINYPPSSRTVRWADDDGGDLVETQQDSPPSDEGLTKSQRKKRNKQARKEAEARQMVQNIQNAKRSKRSGSTDVEQQNGRASHKKSVSLGEPIEDRHVGNTREKELSSKLPDSKVAQQPPPSVPRQNPKPPQLPDYQSDGALRPSQVVTPTKTLASKVRRSPIQRTTFETLSASSPKAASNATAPGQSSPPKPAKKAWPIADPGAELQRSLAKPAPRRTLEEVIEQSKQASPSKSSVAQTVSTTNTSTPIVSLSPSYHTRSRGHHQILPLRDTGANDRNWRLLLKLMRHFPADNRHILSPLNLTHNVPVEKGLHVFIDASNILIGFHEFLKRARGIPERRRVTRVFPDFAALALVLERRRLASKRVLVGSEPWVDVYSDAKNTGYEVNILEKVYKVRELTERQKKFAARDAARANGYNSNGYGSESGGASGASVGSAAEQSAQKRWLEQGVDETLHAKMGESLVDVEVAENARPTMILATGDFQEAEYTSGFGKWVERALKHGWNVEIAAWSSSISMEYFKMQNEPKWQGRLRVIKLDDFAEELFPVDED